MGPSRPLQFACACVALLAVLAARGATAQQPTTTTAAAHTTSTAAPVNAGAIPILFSGCPAEPYSVRVNISGQGPFNVILDSGSANFAIGTSGCPNCFLPRTYDLGGSGQGAQFEIEYGTGKIELVTTQGTVVFAGAPPELKPAAAVSFGGITESLANGGQPFFAQQGGACFETYEGIWGLAFPAIADGGILPLFDSLVGSGVKDGFTFVMCPDRIGGATQADEPLGQLILGGAASSLLPPNETFVYTPIVLQEYYNVKINDVTVGGQSIQFPTSINEDTTQRSSTGPIVDTGTTSLLFNTECNAFAFLYAFRNAVEIDTPGEAWVNPCDPSQSLPNMAFWRESAIVSGRVLDAGVISEIVLEGNVRLPVAMAAIFISGRGELQQSGVLASAEVSENQVVLGQTVLRGRQMYFDRSGARIGFAPVTSTACSQVVTPTQIDIIPPPQRQRRHGLSSLAIFFIIAAVVLVALTASVVVWRQVLGANGRKKQRYLELMSYDDPSDEQVYVARTHDPHSYVLMADDAAPPAGSSGA